MNYQDYIGLGFEPTNQDSQGEFNESGFVGFSLVKKIDKNVAIMASSGELDKPKIFILLESRNAIVVHTTCEDVQNIVKKLNATA